MTRNWVVRGLVAFCFCFSGVVHSQGVHESTAFKVYEDLVVAVGNVHPRAPRLVLKNSKRNPASFNPFTKEISLERKVLEICHSFGPDSLSALAYILGHELAHSYCEHGWQTKFAGLDFSNEVDQKLESIEQRVDDETEADLKAGFYAHLAGYEALRVADEFLQRVYDDYDLPDSIPGYPKLNQRVEIINENKARFEELKRLYDSAVHCVVLGQFDYATTLFDQIVDEGFTSREIYNNLGLCLVYRALGLNIEGLGGGLVYPFELDIDTRLSLNDVTRGSFESSHAVAFLEDAEKEFETALRLSPDYSLAKSNLFFTQLLLKSIAGVDFELRFEPEEIADIESTCSNCLDGLCKMTDGNVKKGVKCFKRGAKEGCKFCSLNANSRMQQPREKSQSESLLEYNGIDIYCKDFAPSDCDVFLTARRKFEVCYRQHDVFSQTMIKMKQRGNRACITLIEVSEGAVERLPEIEIGSLESSLVARLGDCEAFRAGASTYYMSKDKDIAFEVTQGIVNRGLYFERID